MSALNNSTLQSLESLENKIYILENKIDKVANLLDQILQQNIKDSEKLNSINSSSQNMDHHINFVENVFDVVKHPFSSLLRLYYGNEIKNILDVNYNSRLKLD